MCVRKCVRAKTGDFGVARKLLKALVPANGFEPLPLACEASALPLSQAGICFS